MNNWFRLIRLLLTFAFITAVVGTSAAAAGRTTAGVSERTGCGEAPSSGTDAWKRVPAPPGGVRSLGQLDENPCILIAVTPAGNTWRSKDAGRTWARGPKDVDGVLTEGTRVLMGGRWTGPIIANGTTETSQVETIRVRLV